MKNRWKFLIAVGGAILVCYLWSQFTKNAPDNARGGDDMTVEDMNQNYIGINSEYFGDTLPKDTIIEYAFIPGHSIAQTAKDSSGRFHIIINTGYSNPGRYGVLTIEHEACHIKTWGEEKEHGRHWRACMAYLDTEGAFRDQLIDDEDK